MIQGDPTEISLYSITMCPLTEILRKEFPMVLQPWYANNTAMIGAYTDVATCFCRLLELRPMFGYHLASSKSWSICSTAVEWEGRVVFVEAGLEVKW